AEPTNWPRKAETPTSGKSLTSCASGAARPTLVKPMSGACCADACTATNVDASSNAPSREREQSRKRTPSRDCTSNRKCSAVGIGAPVLTRVAIDLPDAGCTVAGLVEQRLVARHAAILENAGPAADRHELLRNQRPDLRARIPRLGIDDRIDQRQLHAQPVRARPVPAFLEDGLIADRKAVLVEPLPVVEARRPHDERVAFPVPHRVAVEARQIVLDVRQLT